MKKITALLLTLAMLLSLTACSISFLNRETNNNADAKPEPPVVQPEEPSIPDGDGDDIAAVEPEIPDDKPDALLPDPEKDDDKEAAGPEETRTVMSSHKDVTLFSAGETFRLTVWDSNGKDPDTCTYTSADPSVAAVDEAGGEVTAVAPGTTTVTAHVSYGDESQDFDCIVRCSWKAEEAPPASTDKPVSASVSLNDFFSTLQGSYEGLDSMMALDGELLDTYYPGLSSIDAVEEVLVQETMMTMANMAVGLVKLSGDATSDDIVAVQNALQTRINTQADGGAWYPASCETWKQGIITSTSNVVGMFVYPENAQDMADLFAQTFAN